MPKIVSNMNLEWGFVDKFISHNSAEATDFRCTGRSSGISLQDCRTIRSLGAKDLPSDFPNLLSFFRYDNNHYLLLHERCSPVNHVGRSRHIHKSFIRIPIDLLLEAKGLVWPFVDLMMSHNLLWNIPSVSLEDGEKGLDALQIDSLFDPDKHEELIFSSLKADKSFSYELLTDILNAILDGQIVNIKNAPRILEWRLKLIDYLQILLPVDLRLICSFSVYAQGGQWGNAGIQFDSGHTQNAITIRMKDLSVSSVLPDVSPAKYSAWISEILQFNGNVVVRISGLRINPHESGQKPGEILDRALDFEKTRKAIILGQEKIDRVIEYLEMYRWEFSQEQEEYHKLWKRTFLQALEGYSDDSVIVSLVSDHKSLLSDMGVAKSILASIEDSLENAPMLERFVSVITDEKLLTTAYSSAQTKFFENFVVPSFHLSFRAIIKKKSDEALNFFGHVCADSDIDVEGKPLILFEMLRSVFQLEAYRLQEYLVLCLGITSFLLSPNRFGFLTRSPLNLFATYSLIKTLVDGKEGTNDFVKLLVQSYHEVGKGKKWIAAVIEHIVERGSRTLIDRQVVQFLFSVWQEHEGNECRNLIEIENTIQKLSVLEDTVLLVMENVFLGQALTLVSEKTISALIRISGSNGIQTSLEEASRYLMYLMEQESTVVATLSLVWESRQYGLISIQAIYLLISFMFSTDPDVRKNSQEWFEKLIRHPATRFSVCKVALQFNDRSLKETVVKELTNLTMSESKSAKRQALDILRQVAHSDSEQLFLVLRTVRKEGAWDIVSKEIVLNLLTYIRTGDSEVEAKEWFNFLISNRPTVVTALAAVIDKSAYDQLSKENCKKLLGFLDESSLNPNIEYSIKKILVSEQILFVMLAVIKETGRFDLISEEHIQTLIRFCDGSLDEQEKNLAEQWLGQLIETSDTKLIVVEQLINTGKQELITDKVITDLIRSGIESKSANLSQGTESLLDRLAVGSTRVIQIVKDIIRMQCWDYLSLTIANQLVIKAHADPLANLLILNLCSNSVIEKLPQDVKRALVSYIQEPFEL